MRRLRLARTDERRAFGQAVVGTCADHHRNEGEDHTRPFDAALWRRLGDLGAWSVASSGGGDVSDAAVVAEAVGSEAICGPLVQTFLVATSGFEGHGVPEVEAGSAIAAVADGDAITPWGAVADVLWVLEGAAELAPGVRRGELTSLDTLGGEPWAAMDIASAGAARPASRAVAIANVVAAGYALGAGGRAIQETVDYTGMREQFRRPLLSFQTIEHRLAQVVAELDVAADLVATASAALSERSGSEEIAAAEAAAGRLFASDVALRACLLAHQLAGGMGFVAGTLTATLSTRVQLLEHQPPRAAVVESLVTDFATSSA